MRPLMTLIAALAGNAALAQSPDHDKAATLILPMLQELAPGQGGQVLTACVIASATPEEIATLAAATGPSAEVGAVVNSIVNRPETLACIQAAAQP